MLTTSQASPSLDSWLETAFRGDLPEEVQELLKHRNTMDNVFGEMMTEWPAKIRQPMQHLHQLQQAEMDLLYSVVKNLFLRHLEAHP